MVGCLLMVLACLAFRELVCQATSITLPFTLPYFSSCGTAPNNQFEFYLSQNYIYLSFFFRLKYPSNQISGVCQVDAVKFEDVTDPNNLVKLISIDSYIEKLIVNNSVYNDQTINAPNFKTNEWYFVQLYVDSYLPEFNYMINIQNGDFTSIYTKTSLSSSIQVAPKNFKLSLSTTNIQSFCCFEIAHLWLGSWHFNRKNMEELWAAPNYITAVGVDLTLRKKNTFKNAFLRDDQKSNIDYITVETNGQMDYLSNSALAGDYMVYLNDSFAKSITFDFPSLTYPPTFNSELLFRSFSVELFFLVTKTNASAGNSKILRFGPLMIEVQNTTNKFLVNGVSTGINFIKGVWVRIGVSYSVSATTPTPIKAQATVRFKTVQASSFEYYTNVMVSALPMTRTVQVSSQDNKGFEGFLKYITFSLNPIVGNGSIYTEVVNEAADYFVTSSGLYNMAQMYTLATGMEDYLDSDVKLRRFATSVEACHYGLTENKTIVSILQKYVLFCPLLNGTVCQACHRDCESCRGSSNKHCCSCRPNYNFENGQCTRVCSSQEFSPDNINCTVCSIHCKTCFGPSDRNCSTCDLTKYDKIGNYCQRKCSDLDTYVENQICKKCHPSCRTCNGSSPSHCLSCASGYNYITKETSSEICTDRCCIPCPENCRIL